MNENLKAALLQLRKYQGEKELNVKLGGDYPCTGRTTAMLNVCLDAVLEGQPKSVVIGHNQAHAQELRRLFIDLLHEKIFDCTLIPRDGILYQGSEIRFISKSEYERFMEGRRGWGEFWDHFAENEE